MRKAISPIIATILLIMLTVVASGAAFFWITAVSSGVQETAGGAITVSGCSRINLIAMRGDSVTVQNTGCDTIENITVLIDGVLTEYSLVEPIDPGESTIVSFAAPLEGGEDHTVDVVLDNGFSSSLFSPGPSNIGPSGYVGYCTSNGECSDDNPCTNNFCQYRCIFSSVSSGQYPGCTGSTGCSGGICACMSGNCVNSCGDGVCQSWETSLTCPADNCPIICLENSCSSPNVMFTGAVFGDNIGDICPCCGDDGVSDTFYNNELGRADKFCYKGVYTKSTLDNNKSLCEGFGKVWFTGSPASLGSVADYITSTSPSSVVLGDLDLDGDLDAFVSGQNSISVHFNNGGGFLSKFYTKTDVGGGTSLAAGYMNNDSKLDIVMGTSAGNVLILLNNGSGYFPTATGALASGIVTSVAVGDVDGDSDSDIVAASNDNTLRVFFINGSGSLVDKDDYSFNLLNIDLGDIDSDGDLDIVGISSNSLITLLNNGAGVFSAGGTYTITNPNCLSLGDLNGDLKLDVAVETSDSKLVTMLNSGVGVFSVGGTYNSGGSCLNLGDVDSDGDLDVVTSNFMVLLNNGAGVFSSSSSGVPISGSLSVDIGDLDLDGDLDSARVISSTSLLQFGFNNYVGGSGGLCCGDDGVGDVFYNSSLFCDKGVFVTDRDVNRGFCTRIPRTDLSGNTWFTGAINGTSGPCCGDDGSSDNFDNGTNSCCNGVLMNLGCPTIPSGAVVNSVSITQFTSGIRGYCNAFTSNISGILSYNYNWTKNGVLNMNNVFLKEGSISAGGSHTCGINASNGRVLCWGSNSNGRLGNGSIGGYSNKPIPTSDTSSYILVSAGGSHTCGVRASDSRVLCWGGNNGGQLGNGSFGGYNSTPVLINDTSAYLSVSAGGSHTCGVRASDSRVLCWGWNAQGQLGNSSIGGYSTTPNLTKDAGAYLFISAGLYHTCGVRSDGKIYCWGYNDRGQLGDNSFATRPSPTPTANPDFSGPEKVAFLTVSAGSGHTCALRSDKRVYCWGSNSEGQLGIGTIDPPDNYRLYPSWNLDYDFSSVSAGGSHTCGVRSDGKIYCWGINCYGELGNGGLGIGALCIRYSPTQVGTGQYNYSNIVAGGSHTCGINASNGRVLCWGSNSAGQLGDNSAIQKADGSMNYKIWPSLISDANAYSNLKYFENNNLLVSTLPANLYSAGETWTFACKVRDTINNVESDWKSTSLVI